MLDLKEKIVYDLIEKEKQPILIAVENLMKYTNLEKSEVQYAIVRLQNIGLIKQVSFEDGSTYVVPHWYSKGDEKK
jgi:predicted transcriptional regulator